MKGVQVRDPGQLLPARIRSGRNQLRMRQGSLRFLRTSTKRAVPGPENRSLLRCSMGARRSVSRWPVYSRRACRSRAGTASTAGWWSGRPGTGGRWCWLGVHVAGPETINVGREVAVRKAKLGREQLAVRRRIAQLVRVSEPVKEPSYVHGVAQELVLVGGNLVECRGEGVVG